MEIISYGGGVQTVALLILNAKGKVSPSAKYAVFADTGSELYKTTLHIGKYMTGWAIDNGMELVVVATPMGPLHEFVINKKKCPIPFRGNQGGMLFRRCTDRWKISIVRKWLRQQGAEQAIIQLGISTDEAHRMKGSPLKWIEHRYPLIELGLSRADCINIIQDEGIPIPPKSACFMCPYRKHSEWTLMKQSEPEEFARAVEFEKHLDGLFIHPSLQLLDQAVGNQMSMFIDDECGGYCWT